MIGSGFGGCALAFVFVGVWVCGVAWGFVCGASDVSAASLRCVNGGGVLIYRII